MPLFQIHSLLNLFRTLFGGPSQPEPRDLRGGIQQARKLAEEDESVLNLNQYENPTVCYWCILNQRSPC